MVLDEGVERSRLCSPFCPSPVLRCRRYSLIPAECLYSFSYPLFHVSVLAHASRRLAVNSHFVALLFLSFPTLLWLLHIVTPYYQYAFLSSLSRRWAGPARLGRL